MNKSYYVYILTNKPNGVLYVGVTNDLSRRFFEHVNKLNPESFSAKYKLTKLVYYQEFNHALEAIQAEKYRFHASIPNRFYQIERNWALNDRGVDLE